MGQSESVISVKEGTIAEKRISNSVLLGHRVIYLKYQRPQREAAVIVINNLEGVWSYQSLGRKYTEKESCSIFYHGNAGDTESLSAIMR